MTLTTVGPGAADASTAAGRDDDPLAAYVARVVAEAPPLSESQRDRLALLLGPAGGAAR
jgi:hypothetical protein